MSEAIYKKIFNRYVTIVHHDSNLIEVNTPAIPNNEDELFGDLINLAGDKYYRNPKFTPECEFYNEEMFLKNYGNPLATVIHERLTIVVEKKDQKTVLKVFSYHNRRGVGKKFFKKGTNLRYIGFNEKDGSIYSGMLSNYHLKRKFRKKMTKNTFYTSPMNEIRGVIRSHVISYFPNKPIFSSLTASPEALDVVNEVTSVFISQLPVKDISTDLTSDEILYKLYLDQNNIKYPNNWKIFRNNYPSVKKSELKKHGYKFIDAYMAKYGLNGDKVKRVLHKVETSDVCSLTMAFKLFGKNFVLSHDDSVIKMIIESGIGYNTYYVDNDTSGIQNRAKEKQNAFEIFKICCQGDINISTFNDHLRFYGRLRTLEGVKWKSNNYKSFMEEHLDWTDRLEYYNNGTFTRIYPDKFKEEVEYIILGVESPIFPKLLVNTNEYNEESFLQSNCVKTYVKRESSVIISLRRGSVDSTDRATIEYRILHDGEKIVKLERVQSLGRFNNKLDDDWDLSLFALDERVNQLVKNDVFELPESILEVKNRKVHSKMIVVDRNDFFIMNGSNRGKYKDLKWGDERVLNQDNDLLIDDYNLPFI